MELTDDQAEILRALPTRVYSPGQRTIDKFGPLVRAKLCTVRDVGSDEMQETIHLFEITTAGQAAIDKEARS